MFLRRPNLTILGFLINPCPQSLSQHLKSSSRPAGSFSPNFLFWICSQIKQNLLPFILRGRTVCPVSLFHMYLCVCTAKLDQETWTLSGRSWQSVVVLVLQQQQQQLTLDTEVRRWAREKESDSERERKYRFDSIRPKT